MFSTEGHVFPVHRRFRVKPWKEDVGDFLSPLFAKDATHLAVMDARPSNFTGDVSICSTCKPHSGMA